MADQFHGEQDDGEHVQVHVFGDVDYWCAKFACSEEELRAAVKSVGTLAGDVAQDLKKRGIGRGTSRPWTQPSP